MPPAFVEKIEIDKWAILGEAAKRAGQGGVAGAASIAINICTMMWMRTIVYYQYRYGTTTTVAMKTLYADGGIPRFYRGLLPALIQGPLARFGDIAANTGTLAGFNSFASCSEDWGSIACCWSVSDCSHAYRYIKNINVSSHHKKLFLLQC
jgi:hypothetical protein